MQRRLSALQEFSRLGSGFQLAMRDLEIRGAGSILGKKQWGKVSEVGIEQFSRLLERAIQRIKDQEVAEIPDPEVRLGVEALIPPGYVGDDKVRLAVYKKVAAEETHRGLEEIAEELRDRFGPLPGQVSELLNLGHLRVWARELKVERVQRRGNRVLMVWYPESLLAQISKKRWSKILDARPFDLKGNIMQLYLGNDEDPVEVLVSCLPLLLDGANGVVQHAEEEDVS
jgi:transcription-repair coupling factor (superfamily II helicase)